MNLAATGGSVSRDGRVAPVNLPVYGSPKGIMFDKFTSKKPVCTVSKAKIPKIPPHPNSFVQRAKSTERPSNKSILTARNGFMSSGLNNDSSQLYDVDQMYADVDQKEPL